MDRESKILCLLQEFALRVINLGLLVSFEESQSGYTSEVLEELLSNLMPSGFTSLSHYSRLKVREILPVREKIGNAKNASNRTNKIP